MTECFSIVNVIFMNTVIGQICAIKQEIGLENRFERDVELTRWTKKCPTIDQIDGSIQLRCTIEFVNEEISESDVQWTNLPMNRDISRTSDVDIM